MADYEPISGERIFNAILDKDCIVMAANTRYIPGVAEGILTAAKETDTPVIIEIARSECDLKGGYTGYTPKDFAEKVMEAAKKAQNDKWALHADHIGVKDTKPETIESTKELIKAQIDAGFTSFAIDASHIFNFEGKDEKEELEGNLKATVELAKFIEEELKSKGVTSYGLEVEVGEVGRKDEKGFLLTTPEEAKTFISGLNNAGVNPQVLAIANGSTHGNIYDERGVKIEQVSIDIARTKEIAQALRGTGSRVRIAQHGITGTPLHLIASEFPRGDVIKGNVGTFWQDLTFEVIRVYEPDLSRRMRAWVLEKYAGQGKSDDEIFGKNAKYAFKQFYKEMNGISPEAVAAMKAQAYASALMFFKAFNSLGKGSLVK
ncbi:MAG: class II fructose-bisphosphate aldolase [Candidatus Altiarchaeota archaeon]|nr:class II fructose-bisphosphate aldolase [Candidatus Altiarchaeota archaeon]